MAKAGCAGRAAGARLQRDAVAAVGRVPPARQEPLLSGVNDLEAQLAACGAPPSAARMSATLEPAGIEAVPHESGAAAQARALAAWLRRYSR